MNRLLPLFILLAIALPQQAQAGAWAQAQGKYYIKLSGISYSAKDHFNAEGDKEPLSPMDDRFNADQVFLYAEYGALNRLTITAQGNWGELVSKNTQGRNSTRGTGDWDIGLKYQSVDAPVVLSPYIGLKLPIVYDDSDNPSLGTGDIDIEAKLLAAKSLHPAPVYIGAELGYRLRGGPFSNQIPYSFEVGVTPHKKLFIKTYLLGTNTLIGDSGFGPAMNSMSTQVSEGDFTKWGLSGAVQLHGPLWLDLLYETIFAGKNIGAGSSFGLGLSISR